MIIQKIETWWVRRNKCLFDDKRKGKSAMDWDVRNGTETDHRYRY